MASFKILNKVVFITEDVFGDSVGGVEQHIYHIAKELALGGKHVVIISLKIGNISSRSSEKIFKSSGTITLIKLVKKNLLLAPLQFFERHITGKGGLFIGLIGKMLPNIHFRALIKEVMDVSPDFIHQHDYLANIVASKILSKKLPVFFTNHTGQYLFLEKYQLTRLLQKWLISHYTAIIGPSRELTPNDLRATYIPNGVDVGFFEREDVVLESERIVFICPRRWAPTKGVLFLARALSLLNHRYLEKLKILFAGSDSDDFPWYRDQILEALTKVPKSSYNLLGNLSQESLKSYFSKSHVVVIPSLMEATSLAAMEGMACGLPVISTDVGGMPDVVEHGKTGWLIPSEDPQALADIIVEIIDDKYDIASMGKLASYFVTENRSWKTIASQVDQVYERYIKIYNK